MYVYRSRSSNFIFVGASSSITSDIKVCWARVMCGFKYVQIMVGTFGKGSDSCPVNRI